MTTPTIMEQLAVIAKAAGADLTINDYACAAWNESGTNKTIPLGQMLVALARIDRVFQELDCADES